MSKAIFDQAYRFASRIMEIVQTVDDFHTKNYNRLQDTGARFYGSKESLYRYAYLEQKGRMDLSRRDNENSWFVEYMYTSYTVQVDYTGIYSTRGGKVIFLEGGLDKEFIFEDGKRLPLTNEFKEDKDFQLGLVLDNYELKAYYSAGILAGMGYRGRVKIDDTIVFTNMLRCMKEEMYEYERLGFFRRRS